jgi:hypothetical protein
LRIVAVGLLANELDGLLDAGVEEALILQSRREQEIQPALHRVLPGVVFEDPAEDFDNLRVVQALAAPFR